MCGIAGFQGRFDSELLGQMADAITHRGPDDVGECHSPESSVGLAHRRLAIIHLSPLGHQPMFDAWGTVVIVFNGGNYNFRELRVQLESEGYGFRGHSDSEVLLALHRARGEAMLSLLNSIFAFAIYDQAEPKLFLACDTMAVKPLYFNEGRKGCVFASDLKALLACGGVAGSLDVSVLFRYLGFLWSAGGATPFRGVSRLWAGEALRVKDGRIVRRWRWSRPYWAEVRAGAMTCSPDTAGTGVDAGTLWAWMPGAARQGLRNMNARLGQGGALWRR